MPETTGITNGSKRTVAKMNGKATYAEKHKVADHFIGGNSLANAPPSKVKDFVASHDGHTVITNVSWVPFPQLGFSPEFGHFLGLRTISADRALTIRSFDRSSSQTTESPPSRKSGLSENGRTKHSATRRPSSSL